jgi:hypothetical protein
MLIKRVHGGVGGGICKSVIRSGWLSAKLINPQAPLGSISCGPDYKFVLLHGEVGLHHIRLLNYEMIYIICNEILEDEVANL